MSSRVLPAVAACSPKSSIDILVLRERFWMRLAVLDSVLTVEVTIRNQMTFPVGKKPGFKGVDMLIQMELWHLITLLLAFFSCVGAFGRVLLTQFEKRQTERFKAQEESRVQAQAHWDRRFSALEETSGEWSRIEREFLEFKAELPKTFVMRDDYVRNQTVIEAKLDAIAVRQENILLKGAIK